jgi:hypothetical protein
VQVSGGDHDTVSVNGVADRQPDVPSCDAYYGLQLSCAARLTDTPTTRPISASRLGVSASF